MCGTRHVLFSSHGHASCFSFFASTLCVSVFFFSGVQLIFEPSFVSFSISLSFTCLFLASRDGVAVFPASLSALTTSHSPHQHRLRLIASVPLCAAFFFFSPSPGALCRLITSVPLSPSTLSQLASSPSQSVCLSLVCVLSPSVSSVVSILRRPVPSLSWRRASCCFSQTLYAAGPLARTHALCGPADWTRRLRHLRTRSPQPRSRSRS